jgi:hypothetical protein
VYRVEPLPSFLAEWERQCERHPALREHVSSIAWMLRHVRDVEQYRSPIPGDDEYMLRSGEFGEFEAVIIFAVRSNQLLELRHLVVLPYDYCDTPKVVRFPRRALR